MRTDGELTTDTDPTAHWSLVVPLKPLVLAKSRLAPAADGIPRQRLALAFAQDTVAAVLACPAVRDVAVVTDDPVAGAELAAQGARIVPDMPGAGLNAALAHGAQAVRELRPDAPVAALNADLPALRPLELARVLVYATGFPRAFLTDSAGIGTTLLTAAPGVELRPGFGGLSRRRHSASGAVEIPLDGIDSVRRDVDTPDDLTAALALGVGPCTSRLLTAGAAAGWGRGPFSAVGRGREPSAGDPALPEGGAGPLPAMPREEGCGTGAVGPARSAARRPGACGGPADHRETP